MATVLYLRIINDDKVYKYVTHTSETVSYYDDDIVKTVQEWCVALISSDFDSVASHQDSNSSITDFKNQVTRVYNDQIATIITEFKQGYGSADDAMQFVIEAFDQFNKFIK